MMKKRLIIVLSLVICVVLAIPSHAQESQQIQLTDWETLTAFLAKLNTTGDMIILPDESPDADVHFKIPKRIKSLTIAGNGVYNGLYITSESAVALTIHNLELSAPNGQAGIALAGKSELIIHGENKVTGGKSFAGIAVPKNVSLEISGSGALETVGGYGAAGIGGNNEESAGTIIISGGKITAKRSGGGAGIGGGAGEKRGGNGANLTICSNAVVSVSTGWGTAIGGGGGYIGGAGGNTLICDSATVDLRCGFDSACIGGGDGEIIGGDGGIITITGSATVNASSGRPYMGEPSSACIGGGAAKGFDKVKAGSGGIITVSGNAKIVVEGYGTGIGGGCSDYIGGDSGKITIGQNSSVTVKSYDGAGIGSGFGVERSGKVNSITITDNAVVDTYSEYGAGIGSGGVGRKPSSGGKIQISGNSVIMAQSTYGAGIGGGQSNHGCDIYIGDDAIVSALSRYGAGIGGGGDWSWGDVGNGGKVTVAGMARVTAQSDEGAGIGGGYSIYLGEEVGAGLDKGTGGAGGMLIVKDYAVVSALSKGKSQSIGAGSNGETLGEPGKTLIYGGSVFPKDNKIDNPSSTVPLQRCFIRAYDENSEPINSLKLLFRNGNTGYTALCGFNDSDFNGKPDGNGACYAWLPEGEYFVEVITPGYTVNADTKFTVEKDKINGGLLYVLQAKKCVNND